MISPPRAVRNADRKAFTLVETVLAIGISTLFVAGIFTLLSVGLSVSKDASDDTTMGLILRDTAHRVRGQELRPGTALTFYFDDRGRPVEQNVQAAQNNFYCAVATLSTPAAPPPHSNLISVVVKIYPEVARVPNAPVPNISPATTFSLQMTTATGLGWQELDPNFIPKIDL